MFLDVIHVNIQGSNSVPLVAASGSVNSVKSNSPGVGVGNGIGLGSYSAAQLKTQYAYWQQIPFESKVSHVQWLNAITPKDKAQPEATSCHYSVPAKGNYQFWFRLPKLSLARQAECVSRCISCEQR